MLEVATRIIFPLIMVLSAYFFFAGHNTPGGGFAGGLTAGLALVLRYLAGGRYELGETLPLDAGKMLGAGLGLSAGTAAASLLVGAPVLSSALIQFDVPVLGTVKFVTALFFDLGVYLIVVGLVLDVLRSLGARVDVEMARAAMKAATPMTTYLVPLVLIGGLTSAGVYLLLERNMTRMLLGLLLIGNAINLLILTVGGPSGNPPVRGRTSDGETTTADPLAQGMILTAIVITMGIAAFVLALTYRSYRLTTDEEVDDDPEDTRVSELSRTEAGATRRGPSATPTPPRDTELPDELDALPGLRARDDRQRRRGRHGARRPLPVLIPMIAAALTLFAGRRPRLQRLDHAGARCRRCSRSARCCSTSPTATARSRCRSAVGGRPNPVWGRWASPWWWTDSRR